MQQRSKFIQRTSALALAAVLALGMGVQAAGPSTSTVDDRREDLTIFYETLKDSHPDLFANTPEETFLARKAELTEHLDTASDVEFLFGLQSLAALVGDSHTSVQVADSVVDQLNAYPMVLSWRDGHWYLTTVPAEEQDLLGAEAHRHRRPLYGRGGGDLWPRAQCRQPGEAAAAVPAGVQCGGLLRLSGSGKGG